MYKDPAEAERVRQKYEAINATAKGKQRVPHRSPPPPVTPLTNRWMFLQKNRQYTNHKRMHIIGSSRPAWSKRYRQDPPSQSDVVTTDHMDIDGTITVINTSDMDIDGAAAATTATTTTIETVEEEEEDEEDWEEIYGKASEWTNSQPLQDEVEEADVAVLNEYETGNPMACMHRILLQHTQLVSEEDDELSVPNTTATMAIDATQYTTCTPFQSLKSGFGNDPRYNPSLRMRSKSVHIFESSTHQPLQPPKIYADAQEGADAYQTTVQAVLRSCLEKVNIGKGHYAQFFDTDHTHEIWKEHPDFPGYFFSSRGAVLGKSRKFWRSVQRKVMNSNPKARGSKQKCLRASGSLPVFFPTCQY
ncbi:hypothetical protein BC832DRAFT_541561 [Gaertneriomyces semiglobifer]|nr:hypothetical protein BC832DRAFT_541561 [Gaertneriomyces semiglobifer]